MDKDRELVIAARGGDEAAFAVIFEKYKPVVRMKAGSYFMAGGDSDDLIQEGMIGLFKAVRDYNPDRGASFYYFAGMCIERQMISAVKKASSMKNSPLNESVSISDDEREEIPDRGISPEDIIEARESSARFREELKNRLSPFEGLVFESMLENGDYVKTAEVLGCEPKSVDNAIQRIKKKSRALREESDI